MRISLTKCQQKGQNSKRLPVEEFKLNKKCANSMWNITRNAPLALHQKLHSEFDTCWLCCDLTLCRNTCSMVHTEQLPKRETKCHTAQCHATWQQRILQAASAHSMCSNIFVFILHSSSLSVFSLSYVISFKLTTGSELYKFLWFFIMIFLSSSKHWWPFQLTA